jgi:hypothetical protein
MLGAPGLNFGGIPDGSRCQPGERLREVLPLRVLKGGPLSDTKDLGCFGKTCKTKRAHAAKSVRPLPAGTNAVLLRSMI